MEPRFEVDSGALLQRAVALGRKRKTFSFLLDPSSKRSTLRIEESEVSQKPGEFVRRYEPKLRLLLAGRGWEIVAMSQLAAAYYFAHFLIILPLISKFETPLPLPNSISESVLHGQKKEAAPVGAPAHSTTVAG